jgi:3'(2'), 5'-bisphosphate nucleotidase
MVHGHPLSGTGRLENSKEPVPTFDITASADCMEQLTAIGVAAAAAILESRGDGEVHIKADGSPVTRADLAAEAIIRDGLRRAVPAFPIVSEEQAEPQHPTANASYFLVDPLDGTREFIARRDEYTVNICLLSDGVPILGMIVAPAPGLIWRGIVGRGAERLEFSPGKISAPKAIHARARPDGELVVMVSRSHLDARTQTYLDGLPHTRRVACGSSVKFCRLAEGTADHYPRLGPTRDWDVAAGHAVLTAAGGRVLALDGGPLRYGTLDRRIPGFLAWGAPAPVGPLKG